jgi:8-oxo-dGTP pyrophosphatase MutT (NUDIX family)
MGEWPGSPRAEAEQAAALPYRRTNGRLELCLITSTDDGRWILPKGIIDPGDTAAETALKESFEEAGVRGALSPVPLGRYQYAWHEQIILTVEVYLLEVDRVEESWDEMAVRTRRWCTVDEALELLADHPGLELVVAAVAQLQGRSTS